MSLYNLQQKIYENKIDRNFNTTDVGKEIILMTEENGELCDAFIKNDKAEIIDAIGDIMVYGLGLSAIFELNADDIINKKPIYELEPANFQEHIPYLGRAIGRLAKNFKKSNKKLLPELNRRDEFETYIGDLLGYCAKALELVGDNHLVVLEKIILNNTIRTHTGQI
ncbi:MAG: hypothetical protein AABX52_01305 [Nanoarchaeota archaeon]